MGQVEKQEYQVLSNRVHFGVAALQCRHSQWPRKVSQAQVSPDHANTHADKMRGDLLEALLATAEKLCDRL